MSDFLNQFPYSDFHEMNLDWILKKMKQLASEMNDFEAANSITYEGVWDITKQYTAWSVVLDTETGYLKICTKIVPAGIDIDNSDYWMLVSPFKIDTEFDTNSFNAIANAPVSNKFNSIDLEIDTIEHELSVASDHISDNSNAISEEIDARTNADTAINNNISNLSSGLASEITNRQNADNALSTRIDNLVHLEEGSTTGDAELMDIRTAGNGIVYDTAGDAVRGDYKSAEGHVFSSQPKYAVCTAGANIIPYKIYGGEYTIKNGNSNASIATCKSDGTIIEDVIHLLNANATGTFTPTKPAEYLRLYVERSETIIILPPETMKDYVDNLNDITNSYIKNDQTNDIECIFGQNVIPYKVINGLEYTCSTRSFSAAIASCDEDGNIIEEFIHSMPASSTDTFTPTITADYIRIYSLGSQTVTIKPPESIDKRLDTLEDTVASLVASEDVKAERPAIGYENFYVSVNVADYTKDEHVSDAYYNDYGVVALPTNYSASGAKTKLIVLCGGTGERIADNTNPLTFWGWSYFLAKGYAVMDMNGMPTEWGNAQNFPIKNQHYCNKFLLDSYSKGYEYVFKKYNIDRDVYIAGISMGGGASALIVQNHILPVKAHVAFCPALSVFKQDYMKPWGGPNQQITIAGQWSFPDWSTTAPSKQYFLDNYSKVVGFDNLLINTIGDKTAALENYDNQAEIDAFESLQKFYPVPIKIFHAIDDPTVLYRYSQFMVKMIKNAGGLAILRTFPSGGHAGGWNYGSISDTDIDGNTITTSYSFYEALRFLEEF